MAVLFFILALLCVAALGAITVENTDPSELTLLTQTITGFSEGAFLLAAGVLGFLTALFFRLSLASARRSRNRRKELRGTRKDLAARVSELEGENARLRQALERAEAATTSPWSGGTERPPGQREPSPPARPAGTARLSPPPPPPPPGRGGSRHDDLRAEAIALLREEEPHRSPTSSPRPPARGSAPQPLPEETEPVVRLRDFRSPGGEGRS